VFCAQFLDIYITGDIIALSGMQDDLKTGGSSMTGGGPSKKLRLDEFYLRLQAAPPASDRDEAYRLLCSTLNAVEDELTTTPNNPASHDTDGRLYPPQMDNCKETPDRPGSLRCRSKQHYTYFGPDGSIEIVNVADSKTIFSKPGANKPSQ
jgi:hypothetical protein